MWAWCSRTKVSQFELAPVIDEQVLRLKVSVEDFPLVTVGQTTHQLEHEDLEEENKILKGQNLELKDNDGLIIKSNKAA